MSKGKSVRLFLADGTPGGLVTAEIMNWTGHVIAAPRSDLASLVGREEVARTGVYLLLGDDPDRPGGSVAYVGEGDDVSKRLRSHGRSEEAGGKDFWDRAVVLTSKDTNLTKAHARYLEARIIELAAEAGRVRLLNQTAPDLIPLPEADRSDMEFFVEQARIVLPVLGLNLLRSTRMDMAVASDEAHAGSGSPILSLSSAKVAVDAVAQEVDGEFIVREGSTARARWVATGGHSYKKLRLQLEEEGVLVPVADGSAMTFETDCVFASPSAAAAVVLGRNANGRLEWKVRDTGVTYAQWQERPLDTMAVGMSEPRQWTHRPGR